MHNTNFPNDELKNTDDRPVERNDFYHRRAEPQGVSATDAVSRSEKFKTFLSKIPVAGIAAGVTILLLSAGATYFFLTRPPEGERFFIEGQQQLANGQYAFALKSLEQARATAPNNAKVYLTLARAYIGVDQIDQSWACISKAQELGAAIADEPKLASELSNYYRQKGEYARSAELLRPLAERNIPGKKAELADLLALWGDECLRQEQFSQAMQNWEEVRNLKEGTRTGEAEARLTSIYQKFAAQLVAMGKDQEALKILANLNTLSPTAQGLERAADLYAKQSKFDLAVDQMRQAYKMSNSSELKAKLAPLLVQLGQELMDKGNAEIGYAYLQEAQGLNPRFKVPSVVLRGVSIVAEPEAGHIKIQGEAWNPGINSVGYLVIKAEIVDPGSSLTVWSNEQRLIDEFETPLAARMARAFEFRAHAASSARQLRIYIDGNLYKTYPLPGQKTGKSSINSSAVNTSDDSTAATTGSMADQVPAEGKSDPAAIQDNQPVHEDIPVAQPQKLSPEEKTLQDLE